MTVGFPFWLYRLSDVTLMVYMLLFLYRKKPLGLSTVLMAVAFLAVSGTLDFFHFVWAIEGISGALLLLTQIFCAIATAQLMTDVRGGRAVCTYFMSATFVMAGDMTGMMVYTLTEKAWVGFLCAVTVHIAVLTLLCIFLRKEYLTAQMEVPDIWGKLCVIPGMFYLEGYMLSVYPVSIYRTPEAVYTVLGLLVIMMFSYSLVLNLLGSLRRRTKLTADNEMLELCARAMRNQVQAVDTEREKCAILRHDTRHRVQTLDALLKAGDVAGARQMLAQEEKLIETDRCEVYCENAAVNGIVARSARRARQQGVAFSARLDIPRELPVSDLDFAVVVANLTENALHALELVLPEQRRMELFAARSAGQLIFEISNPYAGALHFDAASGLPVSQSGEGHGYGMRSVAAFAEKYGAIFDCTAENGVFYARMLLNGVESIGCGAKAAAAQTS